MRVATSIMFPWWPKIGRPFEVADGVSLRAARRTRSSVLLPRLYQTDPIDRLLMGGFDAQGITLRHLLRLGNFGLGTFNDFRGGEMIILGGQVYSISHPHTSRLITDLEVETPFALVAHVDPNTSRYVPIDIPLDYATLKDFLFGFNHIQNLRAVHAVLIYGEFDWLQVRCVQEANPYHQHFSQVGQSVDVIDNAHAILVGFCSGQDFHLHGLIKNGDYGGGHIEDFQMVGAEVFIEELSGPTILRP